MESSWISEPPKLCQICEEPIKGSFIDGKTVYGPWAVMCVPCHCEVGQGFGTGKGQQFDTVTLRKILG